MKRSEMKINRPPLVSASRLRTKGVCTVVALAAALGAVAAAQAAETAPAAAKCTIIVTAAHWSIGTTLKGPSSFTCKSWAEAASADKLAYAGVCLHSPGVPFFSWAPTP